MAKSRHAHGTQVVSCEAHQYPPIHFVPCKTIRMLPLGTCVCARLCVRVCMCVCVRVCVCVPERERERRHPTPRICHSAHRTAPHPTPHTSHPQLTNSRPTSQSRRSSMSHARGLLNSLGGRAGSPLIRQASQRRISVPFLNSWILFQPAVGSFRV